MDKPPSFQNQLHPPLSSIKSIDWPSRYPNFILRPFLKLLTPFRKWAKKYSHSPFTEYIVTSHESVYTIFFRMVPFTTNVIQYIRYVGIHKNCKCSFSIIPFSYNKEKYLNTLSKLQNFFSFKRFMKLVLLIMQNNFK